MFARETGRTLVMPAAQKFYLLNRPAVEFADMFPIEYLSDYMDVITMEVMWYALLWVVVLMLTALMLIPMPLGCADYCSRTLLSPG